MAKSTRKSVSKPISKSTPKLEKNSPSKSQKMAKLTSATARSSKTPKTTASAGKTASQSRSGDRESAPTVMGLGLKTWISSARRAKGAEARSGKRGFVMAFSNRDPKSLKAATKDHLNRWQQELLSSNESDTAFFQGSQGPVWILRLPISKSGKEVSAEALLEKSSYARFRDLAGAVVSQLNGFNLDKLIIDLNGLNADDERAVLIGFEMAAYTYAENRPQSPKARKTLPTLLIRTASEALTPAAIRSASNLALAVNIARHYTNVPGGELNPRTYAENVAAIFEDSKTVEIEIWEGAKLEEERMNLLLAVGSAAADKPRLVCIRYRPEGVSKAPVAIVGKGITFDTGGLDIKPSSGMRAMKKDMGGSAAAVGLAKWAELSELQLPLDIYLSLAENAIGAGAFRPGDIITARSGQTVEIHNTDAEGRLVLADALDVAVTREGADKPSAVINLATLTGAIKVALGAEVAGLFSNNDELADAIFTAGLECGDLSWRMPLFQQYRSLMRSTFADTVNASDGYAGAITAALFLESYAKGVPWAHLDIYAWKDSANGAWSEAGGSGQSVQALSLVLSRMAQNANGEA